MAGQREEKCVDCQPDPCHSSTSIAAPTSSLTVAKKEQGPKKEDVLDPTTFVAPIDLSAASAGMAKPLVIIEYCQRCKFGLRANWIQQELLSTFAPTITTIDSAGIGSIMLIPKIDDESSGRFRIYLLPSSLSSADLEAEEGGTVYSGGLRLVWDRKTQGGFPEMKVLKQRVRDLINPHFGLGHSDRK
ncbi:hypothetical protein NDA11_004304 [Ustilago hordei]|uniref:Selenoprotein W n=1 Tax=Ustilago hordei TaxID=120017 RepID=I2FRG5_USTHO|nr:uncharacterized protein UHO2_05663 [Ustilago hordei]KAJ1572895.1 hypothetical protein NDA15_007490 [Ustilago hordei]KAJ1575243.1 hypothetical protein NDA11_004304 [Ustilago hordei]KAJ1575740.1 hypothetical protein NDA12_004114 [Ustilago hordei]CCF49508.1 uncharacterized protein UHOR_07482 [Ustilago hordei]SYW76946.1 uncharacterized protein UHO2_05663 [Ustilago hordei]